MSVQVAVGIESPVMANHENFEFVRACVTAGVNPLLVGPAGCGKTTIARNLATEMGLPFHYTGAVESSFQLKGFVDAQGRVVETSFVKAYREGGVFLFDEMDASDPSALVAVHAALDNGIFDAPAGVIHRHTNFHFLAAANTWGHGATLDYMGRNHLDGATLDRFVPVAMDYDQAFERRLVADKFPDQVGWADTVHKARAAARDLSLRHIISTRAHLKGAALLNAGIDRERVIDSVLLWGLEQDTKIKMLDAINRVQVAMPAAPVAALPQPVSAQTFTDPRIGQYVPGEGIFMGLWQPRDKDGNLIGIECELYAASKDLRDVGPNNSLYTYWDTVAQVAAIRDFDGHNGGHFENEEAIINALKNGTYNGEYFIPPKMLVDGKDAEGNKIRPENLYDLRNTGAFNNTFTTTTGSGLANWYWSSTENRGDRDFVWTVDFTDGHDVWHRKGNYRLSCRPVRVGRVRHLTI